jgi:hypothetical protein
MTQKKSAKQGKSTSGAEKGWPVRLAMCESAIRKQDEYIFRGASWWADTIVEDAATHVKKNRQTSALDKLVAQGCPRREFLYLLGMCENRGVTNALKMTGYDSVELRKQLRVLRECASVVWRVNGHDVPEGRDGTEFSKFLGMATVKQSTGTTRSTLATFLQLPMYLREYASLVEHAAKYLGGKSDFYLSLSKALLVRFVHLHTKAYHDMEVANLLSAMIGPEYGEVEHRIWRSKYLRRFRTYRPDPNDSSSMRAKKTLLECEAAVSYRMDIGHPGKRHIRLEGLTVLGPA